MKYAIVDGNRQEAKPGLRGSCPACSNDLLAKCGNVRVHHWAHKRGGLCDHWWENETPWHRSWKNRFPTHWQEQVFVAESGEKHIADVKTDRGWAIEFQHSPINPDERKSRDEYYGKLIWVVDGSRRKRDIVQFDKALKMGKPIGRNAAVKRIDPMSAKLLTEWHESSAQVFLDFGAPNIVWWLLEKGHGRPMYVAPFSREEFVTIHIADEESAIGEFEKLVNELGELVSNYERAEKHGRT